MSDDTCKDQHVSGRFSPDGQHGVGRAGRRKGVPGGHDVPCGRLRRTHVCISIDRSMPIRSFPLLAMPVLPVDVLKPARACSSRGGRMCRSSKRLAATSRGGTMDSITLLPS